jgi:hypothetical protein
MPVIEKINSIFLDFSYRRNDKNKKFAALAREQQIGQLLETISTLGLQRKREEGLFVR